MFYILEFRLRKRLHFNFNDVKTLLTPLILNLDSCRLAGFTRKVSWCDLKEGKYLPIYYQYKDNTTYVFLNEEYFNKINFTMTEELLAFRSIFNSSPNNSLIIRYFNEVNDKPFELVKFEDLSFNFLDRDWYFHLSDNDDSIRLFNERFKESNVIVYSSRVSFKSEGLFLDFSGFRYLVHQKFSYIASIESYKKMLSNL